MPSRPLTLDEVSDLIVYGAAPVEYTPRDLRGWLPPVVGAMFGGMLGGPAGVLPTNLGEKAALVSREPIMAESFRKISDLSGASGIALGTAAGGLGGGALSRLLPKPGQVPTGPQPTDGGGIKVSTSAPSNRRPIRKISRTPGGIKTMANSGAPAKYAAPIKKRTWIDRDRKDPGPATYATARAKAGLPVPMNMGPLRKKLLASGYGLTMPAADILGQIERAAPPTNFGYYTTYPSGHGKATHTSRVHIDRDKAALGIFKSTDGTKVISPSTLKQQKELARFMDEGGFESQIGPVREVFANARFGGSQVVPGSDLIDRDPGSYAVMADKLAELGHTTASADFRNIAATNKPSEFGHLKPVKGEDYSNGAKPVGYATARAKAGLPVPMNLGPLYRKVTGRGGIGSDQMLLSKVRDTRGAGKGLETVASIGPTAHLRVVAEAGGTMGGGTDPLAELSGPHVYPQTLDQQKSLVRLMASPKWKQIAPWKRGGRFGLGERPEPGLKIIADRDSEAYGPMSDQLEELGHVSAAETFRNLHSLPDGYASGGAGEPSQSEDYKSKFKAELDRVMGRKHQSASLHSPVGYATERAKAGLPVPMNMRGLRAKLFRQKTEGKEPVRLSAPAADILSQLSPELSVQGGFRGHVFPSGQVVSEFLADDERLVSPVVETPYRGYWDKIAKPRTLKQQKALIKDVADGSMEAMIGPLTESNFGPAGFGEKVAHRPGLYTQPIIRDPGVYAVIADELDIRHPTAARDFRNIAAVADKENFGHLHVPAEADYSASAKPVGYATARAKAGKPVRMVMAPAMAKAASQGADSLITQDLADLVETAYWKHAPSRLAAGAIPSLEQQKLAAKMAVSKKWAKEIAPSRTGELPGSYREAALREMTQRAPAVDALSRAGLHGPAAHIRDGWHDTLPLLLRKPAPIARAGEVVPTDITTVRAPINNFQEALDAICYHCGIS